VATIGSWTAPVPCREQGAVSSEQRAAPMAALRPASTTCRGRRPSSVALAGGLACLLACCLRECPSSAPVLQCTAAQARHSHMPARPDEQQRGSVRSALDVQSAPDTSRGSAGREGSLSISKWTAGPMRMEEFRPPAASRWPSNAPVAAGAQAQGVRPSASQSQASTTATPAAERPLSYTSSHHQHHHDYHHQVPHASGRPCRLPGLRCSARQQLHLLSRCLVPVLPAHQVLTGTHSHGTLAEEHISNTPNGLVEARRLPASLLFLADGRASALVSRSDALGRQ
jgi:hypothetical protein